MAHADISQTLRAEQAIAGALGAAPGNLSVHRNVQVGDAEADFVIERPGAETFVVDVRTGREASRLGWIAQLARYHDLFRDTHGSDVVPILVAVGPDAIALTEAGSDFGVEVIAGDNVTTVADALASRIAR
jgi:hypothetical protein